MIVKQKTVFYCEHCKKHRFTRKAMEIHELHCTMNPERICRWVIDGKRHHFDMPGLAKEITGRAPLVPGDVDWLRLQVQGCPACMLSALRQSGAEYHSNGEWQYTEEVERFRKEERKTEDYAEMRSIEAGWL